MEDQARAHTTKNSEFPKVIFTLLLHIFHTAWGWIVGDKILLSLSGTTDGIRWTHVTYDTQPNPYISQVLEWAQLTLPMSLSPIQACYRNCNRLNPCALTLWAKFRHVNCTKVGISSNCMPYYWARSIHITTYMHSCTQPNTHTLQRVGLGSPNMTHCSESNLQIL
jgi:hypothetical protein